jgi:hypothetical protein
MEIKMTSQIYTEDFAQINSGKWNATIRVVALILVGFFLGYIASEIEWAGQHIAQDAPVNASQDWHGNVMRSDWGR